MTLPVDVDSQAIPINKCTRITTSYPDKPSRSPTTFSSATQASPGLAASFSKKRKRKENLDDQSSCTLEPGIILAEVSEKRHASSGFVGIRPPPLVYPKSLYSGLKPLCPLTRERHVLEEILASHNWYRCFDQPLILVVGGRSNSFNLGSERI